MIKACYTSTLLLGLFVCIQLSLSAWFTSRIQGTDSLLNASQTTNGYHFMWNPFVSYQQSKQHQVESRKAELVKRLNQMYFPDDKAFYVLKLLPLVQDKINERPYDKERWLQMLELQTLARSDGVDRMWSAETAVILGGWENRYQAIVGLICLEEPPQLILDDRVFCERRLESFLTAETRRSLSLLGVDVRAVGERLDLLKASFCLFCE